MKTSTTLTRITATLLIIVTFSSCNVNNGIFQKRKYTKGHHISLKKKVASNTIVKQQEPLSQTTKEDKAESNSNDLLSTDTTVNSADKSIAVNSNKVLEPNKVEKRKTQKNVLLAKVTSHIEKSELGRKITRAVNLKAEISSTNKDGEYPAFLRVLFFIVALVALLMAAALIDLRSYFDGAGIPLAIMSLAIGVLLFVQAFGSPPKWLNSKKFKNTLRIIAAFAFFAIALYFIGAAIVSIFSGSFIAGSIMLILIGFGLIALGLLILRNLKK